MKKFFLVYAVALTVLFAYAQFNGWNLLDMTKSGKWGPRGQNTFHK